jgi:tetratricopeptide (TPR) repeat protein
LLYDTAKSAFEAGRNDEALIVFKQIHDLKWANVGAYLDASECFLRNGEAEESLKLLRELMKTLGDNMGSAELTRAGGLFRKAGDKPSALSAFKLARERYRQGK